MNTHTTLCALGLTAALLAGCSTKPREFTTQLAAPVASRLAFEEDFRTCRTLVRKGYRSDFKSGAATALATGVGTVGTGAAMAGAGLVGISTSGGAAVAATAAMPVVGIFLGFGVSRAIRSGKEGKYKRAMGSCLTEYGYTAGKWQAIKKGKDPARLAASRATEAPVAPVAESALETAATPEPDAAPAAATVTVAVAPVPGG